MALPDSSLTELPQCSLHCGVAGSELRMARLTAWSQSRLWPRLPEPCCLPFCRLDLGGLTKEIMANPNPADFPPFPARQAGSQGSEPGFQHPASQEVTSQAEGSPGGQLGEAYRQASSAAEAALAALDLAGTHLADHCERNFSHLQQRLIRCGHLTGWCTCSSNRRSAGPAAASTRIEQSCLPAGAGLGPPERQQLRSLLQSSNGSSDFNPTLACAGCPTSDTRVRVNDSTVFPWTAVGMLTRTDQSALSRWAALALRLPAGDAAGRQVSCMQLL